MGIFCYNWAGVCYQIFLVNRHSVGQGEPISAKSDTSYCNSSWPANELNAASRNGLGTDHMIIWGEATTECTIGNGESKLRSSDKLMQAGVYKGCQLTLFMSASFDLRSSYGVPY